MEIANLIKELRNKTGAGFLDCKTALSENNNNVDFAVEYLRKKGLAKASKKTSREANEGAIGFFSNENISIIIKINSETDFAAKSETFLNFLNELGNHAIKTNDSKLDKDSFLNLNFKNGKISDYFTNMIAQIGENLILKDLLVFDNTYNHMSHYIHNSYSKNIGKIISTINYKSNKNDDEVKLLSKNLCMHVAAMKPISLDVNDLDESIIENEKKIQRELIINSGKPSNIVDKILEGKMSKFYSEVTLLNQKYVLDQEKNIKQIVKEYSKDYEYSIESFNIITL